MPVDEHFNEPGELIEPLEDPKPTDMPATRSMFVTILIVAGIALAALAIIQYML